MAKTRNSTRKNAQKVKKQKQTHPPIDNDDSRQSEKKKYHSDMYYRAQNFLNTSKRNDLLNYNEDIDMYFDKCIQPTKDKQRNYILISQKEPISSGFRKQSYMKVRSPIKQESHEKEHDHCLFTFKMQQDPYQMQIQNQSPSFGQKDINQVLNLNHKPIEFKVYDHQEVNQQKKDQIDRFLQSQKVQSDIFDRINMNEKDSQIVQKKEKKIQKKRKNPIQQIKKQSKNNTNIKVQIEDKSLKNFKSQGSSFIEDILKRKAQLLTISALTKNSNQIDKVCRILNMFSNTLDSLTNYHELRQTHYHLLNFRKKMHLVLKQQIQTIKQRVSFKKDICMRTMHEKMKKNQFESNENQVKYQFKNKN